MVTDFMLADAEPFLACHFGLKSERASEMSAAALQWIERLLTALQERSLVERCDDAARDVNDGRRTPALSEEFPVLSSSARWRRRQWWLSVDPDAPHSWRQNSVDVEALPGDKTADDGRGSGRRRVRTREACACCARLRMSSELTYAYL